MKDYKIYCVYHDTKLIDEYNLKETDNFKLYFTKKENEEKYNLNYVQLYLNEWIAQYYVWKNNIKSDIVGFCHYSRPLYNYININDQLMEHIEHSQYYTFEFEFFPKSNFVKKFYTSGLGYHVELYKKYIKERYGEFYYDRYIKLLYSPWYYQTYRELYLCKWDVFNNLSSFIDGYIKYLFKDALNIDEKELYKYSFEDYKNLNDYLNNKNWELKDQYNKYHNLEPLDVYFGSPRCIAFMTEFCVGLFFELFYSNKNF